MLLHYEFEESHFTENAIEFGENSAVDRKRQCNLVEISFVSPLQSNCGIPLALSLCLYQPVCLSPAAPQKKIMIIICCVILGVVLASTIGGTLGF